jgi:Icc-related predicted phosphoesterase
LSELKFIAMSDLEGRYDLVNLLVKADLSKYDFLLYKGDTPDPSMYKKIRKEQTLSGVSWDKRCSSAIIEDFPETKKAFGKAIEDSTKINDLFAIIKKRLPIFGVLGNSDTAPTVLAPKLGLKPVDFGKNITIIHNKIFEFKGFTLIGYNGRAQYVDETIVDAPQLYFKEEKAEADLNKLFQDINPDKMIFVTHAPPYCILDKVNDNWVAYGFATYGEKAKEGHIGSNAFRNIALTYQPLIHTFGHVHETAGVIKQGKTTFINGGAFGESEEIEEVDIKDGEVVCKWVKVSEL